MADHVGVYAISGAFMPNPGTTVLRTATPSGVLTSRTQESTSNQAGSVVVALQIPRQDSLADYGNEVIKMNAMQSGSLVIESSSYGVVVEIPTYYSKASRLNHITYKRQSSLEDVFLNIPTTSPSGSVSGTTYVYNKYVGSLSGTISRGSSLPGPFWIVLANPADQTAVLHALSGNIVHVASGAYSAAIAIVSAIAEGGTKVTVFPAYSEARQPVDGLDWTSGTVSIHSWIPLSSSVSGVYVNSTFYDPVKMSVPIVEKGRIRDIRVWVELIHDHRNVDESALYNVPGVSQYAWGLQSLQVALRSPNTNFNAAHPIWNAPERTRSRSAARHR